MTEEYPVLPKFNELLEEVHSSLEESDAFDLDSADPASKTRFDELQSRYKDDAQALIEFVAANRDALIKVITELP